MYRCVVVTVLAIVCIIVVVIVIGTSVISIVDDVLITRYYSVTVTIHYIWAWGLGYQEFY